MSRQDLIRHVLILIMFIVLVMVTSMVDAGEITVGDGGDILPLEQPLDLGATLRPNGLVGPALNGAESNMTVNSMGSMTEATQSALGSGVISNPVLGTGPGSPIGMVTPKTTVRSGSF